MSSGTPLTDDDRWPWLDAIAAAMRDAPDGVIVTCSSLRRVYRDRLRERAGRPVLFVFLDGSKETIAARLAERKGHFMPPSLLDEPVRDARAAGRGRARHRARVDRPAGRGGDRRGARRDCGGAALARSSRGPRQATASKEHRHVRLQRSRDASRQPLPPVEGEDPVDLSGEPHRRQGPGGDGDRRHRRRRGARPRPRLEDIALDQDRPRRDRDDRRHRGAGRDPAHLDDADRHLALHHPPHLLGRQRRSRRSRRRSATSSPPAGANSPRSRPCRSASIPAARSTRTSRCRSAGGRGSRSRTSPTSR